jgi:tetratricopeptide (TPR) repeat protein
VTLGDIETRLTALLEKLDKGSIRFSTGTSLIPYVDFAQDALKNDRADFAIQLLLVVTQHVDDNPEIWRLLAQAFRAEQRTEEAFAGFEKAKFLEPTHPATLLGYAQLCLETGRASAQHFEAARTNLPDDLRIVKSLAVSLAAEGQTGAADALLKEKLHAHPDWIDGHKQLSTLRSTAASGEDFAESFVDACTALPQNMQLRLAWFQALASARQWNDARRVIEDGKRIIGDKPGFDAATVFIASESGDRASDTSLFDTVSHLLDPGLDLCHVRHLIRLGEAAKAQALCLRNLTTAASNNFWPYLSLIWRLTGDARAHWLDGDPRYIAVFDLGFTNCELSDLADTLRALHIMEAPYLEQSVRGGTQTDRPLFFRNDPIIQSAKARITGAVSDYIQALPPRDPTHPLLGPARGSILFEGSWSVRLTAQGFHACHTHPMGWISSAFYVSLPAPNKLGSPPAGWIAFGTPPPELKLDLPGYELVEPKAGRLVLFPSTMWHSTVPFDDGERLTIAFDVRRPR